jgi:GTP-binding protein
LPKLAIIGQPNVGKSSLLNALTGQERTIVSDIAGTTRDTIHTHYKLFQKEFILIDTAGIRRKTKVHEDLEFYSVIRAIKAMDEADVCLLLLDAEKGITAQDLNIFSLAAKKGKGIVVLVNKWDLLAKETNTAKEYEKQLKQRLAPFTDVPILFISALEKTRIFKAVEIALEVYENRKQNSHFIAQRYDAQSHSGLSSTGGKGLSYQNKICNPVAHCRSQLCILLQFSRRHQTALQKLSGKQTARKL